MQPVQPHFAARRLVLSGRRSLWERGAGGGGSEPKCILGISPQHLHQPGEEDADYVKPRGKKVG